MRMKELPLTATLSNAQDVIIVDTVSKETRSRMMSSVRGKNTKIELDMRRRLFAMGLRYRLHRTDLPGTPDMVFPKYQVAIFLHGCFWHYHGCRLSSLPGTRQSWWEKKLEDNAKRDADAVSRLQKMRWRVLVVWECGFRKPKIKREEALDAIAARAADFIRSTRRWLEIPRLSRKPSPNKPGKDKRYGEKQR